MSSNGRYDENAPLHRPAWVTWVAVFLVVVMVLTVAAALVG